MGKTTERIGVELEISNVSRKFLRATLDNPLVSDRVPQFSIGDDGSLRSQTFTLGGVGIQPMSSKKTNRLLPTGSMPAEVVGSELISVPTHYEDWLESAPLIAKLFGHLTVSPRSSIHTHTDFNGQPWRRVQNYISWFYHLEAPLYRLARMGQPQHRGVLHYDGAPNDHRYARPLSNPIGMAAFRKSSYVPCINIDGVLNASSFSEMIANWGRLDLYWRQLGHYSAHRLHGLNIVSLVRHGTLELRLFNGCLRYFPQAVRITHGLYKLSEQPVPKGFDPMPLGSKPKFTLSDIAQLLDMSSDELRPLWRVDGPYEWVDGPAVRALPHHYSNDSTVWYNIDSYYPVNYVNNQLGRRDSGFDDFIPSPSLEIPSSISEDSARSLRLRGRFSSMESARSEPPEEPDEDDDEDEDEEGETESEDTPLNWEEPHESLRIRHLSNNERPPQPTLTDMRDAFFNPTNRIRNPNSQVETNIGDLDLDLDDRFLDLLRGE